MRSKPAASPSASTTVRHVPLHATLAPMRMPSSVFGGKLELQPREVADVVEGDHLRGALHETGKQRGRGDDAGASTRGKRPQGDDAGLERGAAARAPEPARRSRGRDADGHDARAGVE